MLRDEFLAEYRLSQSRLAKAVGISPNRIAEIVNNRRRITADTALRLGLYFGTSPEFWMNLQTRYDLKMARRHYRRKRRIESKRNGRRSCPRGPRRPPHARGGPWKQGRPNTPRQTHSKAPGGPHLRGWEERRQAIAQTADKAGRTRDLLARQGIECPTVTGIFDFESASGVYNDLQCRSYTFIFMDADCGREAPRPNPRTWPKVPGADRSRGKRNGLT